MANMELYFDGLNHRSRLTIDGKAIRGIAGIEISRATLVHFIDGTILTINHPDQKHLHKTLLDDEMANIILEKSRHLMLEHEDD